MEAIEMLGYQDADEFLIGDTVFMTMAPLQGTDNLPHIKQLGRRCRV